MPASSDTPQNAGPSPAAGTGTSDDLNRRRAERYPFTAAAEVTEIASRTRVVGRSSDLGPGGCYVDTLSPFPEGTVVLVTLAREGRKLEAQASVVYAHTSMGLGLACQNLAPAQSEILNSWMAELRGEPVNDPSTPEIELAVEAPVAAAGDLRPALHELINLMVRKKLLSDNEKAALLRLLSS